MIKEVGEVQDLVGAVAREVEVVEFQVDGVGIEVEVLTRQAGVTTNPKILHLGIVTALLLSGDIVSQETQYQLNGT